jgi:hypothetical protein
MLNICTLASRFKVKKCSNRYLCSSALIDLEDEMVKPIYCCKHGVIKGKSSFFNQMADVDDRKRGNRDHVQFVSQSNRPKLALN